MFRLVSFVVTALLLGMPVYAQDKTSEIDKIFSSVKPTAPGCAVAVSQHGKLVVNRAYGSADLERDVPLSPSSIFDIGSVRKQFVAAAVLLLVEEGRLSLSDDIRKHFPELPDYGHKITVDHLLTHTSGIRDWTGLRPLAGGNADVVSLILRQRGLNFAPGEEWSYSNSGYVLLTDLVARTSGMSFPDFTRKRLFEPLGMKTTMSPNDLRDVIKNRALGYEREGNGWRVGMYVGNERGSGGGAILTTAADLVIWNDALTIGRLGAFVSEKLQEQARLNNGRKLSYARGLIVDSYRGGTLVSHSGSAAGYSAWLGRLPAQGLSIAVLCNEDETSASALARRVGDLFLPRRQGRRNGRGEGAAAVAEGAARGGSRPEQQGGAVLQRADGRAAAPDRQQRQVGHRRRRPARAGDDRPVPQSARQLVLQVTGRVRTALPVPGPVRAEIHGGADDTVSPRPALLAHRRRPGGLCGPIRKRRDRVSLPDGARKRRPGDALRAFAGQGFAIQTGRSRYLSI